MSTDVLKLLRNVLSCYSERCKEHNFFGTNKEIDELFLKTGKVDHLLMKVIGKCGKDSLYFELNLEGIL